jgi:Bacterial membrane protein YfhO
VRWTLASFAIAAAAFVVAHPPMLGVGGQVMAPGWDATRVFWADLAFARHAVAEGSLPLWNPYDRLGHPFLAEPQSGMFDPVTLLLVGVALVLGHAPAWLIVLKAVVCFGIGGAGMVAFLREHGLPRWAVAAGAALFVLCPRMDKLKDQSALWPTVWAGWLLLALDRCLCGPSPRRGVWLGVAAALVLDAGYPPTAFRLLLLVVPYAAWRVVVTARAREDRRAYLVALGRALGVAAVITTLLCAAQIWATLGVLPQTQRAQLELADVLASGTRPDHWRGLVAPLETKTGLLMYVGVATTAGMLAGLGRRPRGPVVVVGVVGVVGFLLACGENWVLLPALAELPGFRSFRIAGHYLTLVTIAAALLGPWGLARLAEAQAPRWHAPAVALVVLVAALAFSTRPDSAAWIVAVLSALAVAGLSVVPMRWRPHLGWAVVATLVVELLVIGRPVAEILQPLPDAARSRAMAEALDDRVEHRIADFGWAGDRPGPREGVRDLVGHRPALTDIRYLMVYEAARASTRLLAAMNVELVGWSQAKPRRRSGMREVETEAPGLYRVRDPWPLAYWTAHVAVVDDPVQALERLRKQRTPVAVLEAAHLGDAAERVRGLEAVGSDAQAAVAARVVEYRTHRVVLELHAPADGLVVIAEGYDVGWEADVDGEPIGIHRANLVFRAVPVTAGSHRITLEYRPVGVVALCLVWALTWLGIVAWAVHGRYARARAA